MKVSIVCACKNRIKPLLISLQSWLLYDEIEEIIIVDWSSDEPIDYITELSSKIKVVRVNDQNFFNQPQPLNLALKFCTQEFVMKVDCDYILNPYWNIFDYYPINDLSFVCGDTDLSVDHTVHPYFKYLRGLLIVKKKFLEDVGGWNENMGEYYGGEDGEVERRLEMYGLEKRKLNLDYSIIHIPHSNKERIINFSGYQKEILTDEEKYNMTCKFSGDELKWNTEYLVTQYHINHNLNVFYNPIEHYYIQPKTNWDITELTSQNYTAEMIGE